MFQAVLNEDGESIEIAFSEEAAKEGGLFDRIFIKRMGEKMIIAFSYADQVEINYLFGLVVQNRREKQPLVQHE